MRETFDKPPANGRRESEVEPWSAPRPVRPPITAGEVSMPTVLRMPLRRRLAAEWNEMVRQTAERFRVNPESKLRWVPVLGLLLSLALAITSTAMAYGLWRGRGEARADALAENQLATAALINASEARLTRAAEKLEQSAKDMRTELNAKVGAIDDKVDSIRGAVSDWRAEQSAELAGLRAQLEAANDDKGRLWQSLETYRLKLERLEREQRGASTLPSPNPPH